MISFIFKVKFCIFDMKSCNVAILKIVLDPKLGIKNGYIAIYGHFTFN